MSKQTLEISKYYIKKQNDEGLIKNDGTVDTTSYSKEGHTHDKEDITDLSHSHGNILNDGTIDPNAKTTSIDKTNNILYADNNDKIKATKTISDYSVSHDESLNNLNINSSTSQHVINRQINSKIGTITNALDNVITEEDVTQMVNDLVSSSLVDMIYPVGSIYVTTNNVNPSSLFDNTEWRQIEGRFLLASGTTSGTRQSYTPGNVGGSKDAIIVEHNHEQKAHTHKQDSHTHEQNSHNHIQDSHNHTQVSHNHTQNGHNHSVGSYKILGSNVDVKINPTKRTLPAAGNTGYSVYTTKSGGIEQYSTTNNTTASNNATTASNNATTATNQPYTATNKMSTAINQNTIAENIATGESGENKNMPPYIVVNVWERTA